MPEPAIRRPENGHDQWVISAVLVAFNRILDLRQLVERVNGQIYIVDNSTDHAIQLSLAEVAARSGAVYVTQSGNSGIGKAQNRGFRMAVADGADAVLILDDDSSPTDVEALAATLRRERLSNRSTLGVGPRVVDERTGEALVYAWQGPRLRQLTDVAGDADLIDTAFLVASGSLLYRTAFDEVGEFRGDYFIDGVDVEWGLRATRRGYRMIVDPTVTMAHSLGDGENDKLRYSHTSLNRDYYLTRNTFLLVHDVDISLPRRIALAIRFAAFAVIKLVRGGSHRRRLAIVYGIVDAFRGRRGPIPPDVQARLT